ncbi:MAG: Thiol:disulfide oxidoreductase related to ResA [Labilithrix sp.]|nr:Thiol:disulfide oxidoreductase related to ResA [Labilithrix sp.]
MRNVSPRLSAALASLALASALTLSACGRQEGEVQGAASPSNNSGPGGVTAKGVSAPDFTARDIDGKTVKLSDHLGKEVILLDFCATWCEPCIAEFPHLRKLYEANKGKGFYALAIAMDGPETLANVPSFAKRNQLNFPLVTDEDSRIAALYNPKKSAPLSIIIDRSGKITAIREGYNPGDERFVAEDLAKALDPGGASH